MPSSWALFRSLAFVVLWIVTLLLVVSCSGGSGGGTTETSIPKGQQVQAFQLPDVVSGRQVTLADYLGKQDVVIVSYMGFF